jgi:hypothetical protein
VIAACAELHGKFERKINKIAIILPKIVIKVNLIPYVHGTSFCHQASRIAITESQKHIKLEISQSNSNSL